MAKGKPNLGIGYNPGIKSIQPGKPVGSGNAGQDLVNKIRGGSKGAWGGGRW